MGGPQEESERVLSPDRGEFCYQDHRAHTQSELWGLQEGSEIGIMENLLAGSREERGLQ